MLLDNYYIIIFIAYLYYIIILLLHVLYVLYVDCEVGAWGEYGECSTPCGAGVSSRVREVLVAPDSGGEKCPNLLDTMPCFQPPCADSKYQNISLLV